MDLDNKVVFFWHMLVVVGTVEGGRAPTKIKTDLKKPIVNLACHPRLPVLVTYCFPFFSLFSLKRSFCPFPSRVLLMPNAYCFLFQLQYVAYADGLIRAYNIHTYAVHYTLQRELHFTMRPFDNLKCGFNWLCFHCS